MIVIKVWKNYGKIVKTGQKFASVEGRKYPCNQYHFASQQLGVLKKKNRDQSRIFHSNNLKSD